MTTLSDDNNKKINNFTNLPVECFYTAFQQIHLICASRTTGIEYLLIFMSCTLL